MKDILLYQVQEMLENFVEAEHKGNIKITDVEMEDYGYHNEDEERSLNITIDYIPGEFGASDIENEHGESTLTLEIDNDGLIESMRESIKNNIKDYMKVTY